MQQEFLFCPFNNIDKSSWTHNPNFNIVVAASWHGETFTSTWDKEACRIWLEDEWRKKKDKQQSWITRCKTAVEVGRLNFQQDNKHKQPELWRNS